MSHKPSQTNRAEYGAQNERAEGDPDHHDQAGGFSAWEFR